MANKKLMNIEVRTLPNGYGLTFDGMRQSEGYMYFTKEELLQGFMLHIGLEITDQLSTENMQDFLVAVMNYKENKKCLQEIERLKMDISILKGRRNSMARKLIRERGKFLQLRDSVHKAADKCDDENAKITILKSVNYYAKTRQFKPDELGLTSEDLKAPIDDDDEDDEE
jgi:hypothetical protein